MLPFCACTGRHDHLLTGPGNRTAPARRYAGQLAVLAGLRQQFLEVRDELPGARDLDSRFLAVERPLAMAEGRPAGIRSLREFGEAMKAPGLVAAWFGGEAWRVIMPRRSGGEGACCGWRRARRRAAIPGRSRGYAGAMVGSSMLRISTILLAGNPVARRARG